MYHGKRAQPSKPGTKKKLSNAILILLLALFAVAVVGAAIPVIRYLQRAADYNPTISSGDAVTAKSTESGSGWTEALSYLTEEVPYDASCFHRDEKNRIVYDDGEYVSKAGIDVSVWQGTIDWEKVKNDGIDFVILRIGYMSYDDMEVQLDSRYQEYLAGLEAAGIPFGIYFYSNAVSVTEAELEAEQVLELLGNTKPELPIFYDWERTDRDGDRTRNSDAFMIAASCRTFCDILTEAGYSAGIYLNSYLLQNDVYAELMGEYPVWMAEYDEAPTCVGEYEYWQYTNEGEVDGIDADVDMDIWFVPKSEAS